MYRRIKGYSIFIKSNVVFIILKSFGPFQFLEYKYGWVTTSQLPAAEPAVPVPVAGMHSIHQEDDLGPTLCTRIHIWIKKYNFHYKMYIFYIKGQYKII